MRAAPCARGRALAGAVLGRRGLRASVLAEPARSRMVGPSDTGKESRSCRKGEDRRSTGTSPPKARICRATRLPAPDGVSPRRLTVPAQRLVCHPIPDNPRRGPVEPGRSPARRPLHLVATDPKVGLGKAAGNRSPLEDRCIFSESRTRRSSTFQAASPSKASANRSARGEGRTAVVRRFHVQEDARPTCRERQYKIARTKRNLVNSFA